MNDLISRQAAIEIVNRNCMEDGGFDYGKTDALNELERLPSAEPANGDLISREEVMAVLLNLELGNIPFTVGREIVNNLPGDDLVRCKECKRYESDGGPFMTCTLHDLIVEDECFCWWGERREE